MHYLLLILGAAFTLWLFSVSPVFGVIVGMVIFGVFLSLNDKNKVDKNKMNSNKSIQSNKTLSVNDYYPDFKISQKFTSPGLKKQILMDQENKKVAIISFNHQEIYNYTDILSVEVIEDGVTITSTSTSSQIGRAIIGGVIAGGVGAVIGGVGGKKSSEPEIKNIDLKVIVNNPNNPVKIINFLSWKVNPHNAKPVPIKKDSSRYRSARQQADHWYSLLTYIIKQEEKGNVTSQQNENNSVADELSKLSELVKQGILTQDEFDQQKKKILSV